MKAAELEAFCPHYHLAVELIGRRWTGAILRAMLVGVSRFSELAQTIPGLSQRMLSERLKELEAEGVVVRSVTPSVPVRVEYHLTEKGQSLGSVIEAVARWAEQWADPTTTTAVGFIDRSSPSRGFYRELDARSKAVVCGLGWAGVNGAEWPG